MKYKIDYIDNNLNRIVQVIDTDNITISDKFDTSETNNTFVLYCKAGKYESESFFGLILMVIKHRFSHLIKDGVWMD